MKKALFSLCMAFIAFSSWGQIQVIESGKHLEYNAPVSQKSKLDANDTITPPEPCGGAISFVTTADSTILTSTFKFSSNLLFTKLGQILNTSGDSIKIHGLIALIAEKEEGPSKGSFTGAIYDTTNGIGSTPLATTIPVHFDSINDTNSTHIGNYFEFANPIIVDGPFWATLDVDNGSDTLSLFSTPHNCGFGSIANINDTSWYLLSDLVKINTSDLQISTHIWAVVDSLPQPTGSNRNFISSGGLKFFPNPAKETATIEFNMPGENQLTLRIQDMAGREVYNSTKSFNGGDREFNLDVSGFENGAYTYQIVGKNGQLNGVFVKE